MLNKSECNESLCFHYHSSIELNAFFFQFTEYSVTTKPLYAKHFYR